MSLSDKLRGTVRAEIRAAFPEALLNACAARGILLRHVERLDACTLRADIYERDWDRLRELAPRCHAEAEAWTRQGGSRDRRQLSKRAALFCSLLCVSALLLWSGLHIWEIEVRGCETLTSGQVLRALEDSGVSIGTYWPALSADAVRARMLLRLPELAWMTVNVSGSRALVYVVERTEKPEIYAESAAADVVAARTGILRDMTVLNGRPLVRCGSAVVAGETLVTGALDSLSHPTRYVRAEARVLAETWYEWTAAAPEGREKSGGSERVHGCLALQFGKKRVNLFRGSRKELDGYDKIVHEYSMGVRGLFAFPLSLIREEYRSGRETGAQASDAGERLREALASQIDGEILQTRLSAFSRDGIRYTDLRAHCLENIAQTAERDPP